jgi:arsenite-transporting ATPase
MANVEAIIEDKGLKFLFVGGKGGVGKTTCSSAIACQLAYERKILLISTDPAHSLGDAFRIKFSGEPTAIPGVPNLEVMEVNPETNLQEEIKHWAEMARKAGMDEMLEKVSEFQEWLSGVPGIDEATALTSVIGHIESGTYDLIVFDTAPTGHTLKLLQLPKILQAGLDKLQSWQAKMWDVWQLMKGAVSTGPEMSPAEMKRAIADKLQEYKDGMEKISVILKDTSATNFMIVCIAEYLSINESQRLLSELQRNNIRVTHIVVNQLVKGWVSDAEMPAFDALLSVRCCQFVLLPWRLLADPTAYSTVHVDGGCPTKLSHTNHAATAGGPATRGGYVVAEDPGLHRADQRAWWHPGAVPRRPTSFPRGVQRWRRSGRATIARGRGDRPGGDLVVLAKDGEQRLPIRWSCPIAGLDPDGMVDRGQAVTPRRHGSVGNHWHSADQFRDGGRWLSAERPRHVSKNTVASRSAVCSFSPILLALRTPPTMWRCDGGRL